MNRRNLVIGGASLVALGAGAAYAGTRGMGSSSEYNDAARTMRGLLSAQPETQDLIRYAIFAPNGHNTQPWRFALAQRQITIQPDFSHRTPVVDTDDHHVFVSLGCAAETLALAAAARGHACELRFDASNDGSVGFDYGGSPPVSSTLFDAIPQRQSTRAEYDGRAVSPTDLKTLRGAAAIPGVDLVLIREGPQMDRLRDLVLAGNDAQMGNPAFIRELKSCVKAKTSS